MGFGSMQLQETPGAQMGTIAGSTTPMGDTLPFAAAGTVPTATGSGWAMLPAGASPVVSVSAAYTATINNHLILLTTTSAFTVTLPPAGSVPAGFELIFKFISGTNIVTLATGVATDKIEGGTAGVSNTAILPATAFPHATLVSDGVGNWWVTETNLAV